MKKLTLIIFLLHGTNLMAHDVDEHPEMRHTRAGIILTSPLLGLIDGLSFGINATHIKMMLVVHRELKKIIFGEHGKMNTLEGRYVFENQKHSVKSLVQIEAQRDAEYLQKRTLLLTNPVSNEHAINVLDQDYNKTKQELRNCLLLVKKEFEERVAPFEKNARGAKEQMLVLMTESCQKHNRPDSPLLKWADTQEGNELVYMRDHINTFQAFDLFCTDLLNFLEDLMRSCPKAWKQFKQQLEAAKQSQGTKS